MRLTFELPVRFEALPKRGSYKKKFVATVPVEVEVREVTAEDVVHVASLDYLIEVPHKSGRANAKPETVERHIELFDIDGILHKPADRDVADMVSLDFGLEENTPPFWFVGAYSEMRSLCRSLSMSTDRQANDGCAVKSFVDIRYAKPGERYAFEPLSSMAFKETDEVAADINRQIDDFRSRIARVTLVAGQPYVVEDEPMISAKETTLGNVELEVIGSGEVPGLVGDYSHVAHLGFYKLSELATVRDEMPRLMEQVGLYGKVVDRIKKAEVYDETAFTADCETMSLATIGAMMRERFHWQVFAEDAKSELAKLPLKMLALYQSLRRGVDAAFADGETDELEASVRRVVEATPGRDVARYYFGNPGVKDRIAETVLERWDSRPLNAAGPTTVLFARR